jgi:two-component system phosphate regulon sensor histidine kinase PhoR
MGEYTCRIDPVMIRNGMKFFRKLFTPLIAFITIQLVWLVMVFFWIRWFMQSHSDLQKLAEKYSHVLPEGADWLILTEGLVLLVAILVGVYVIFLYWQRQAALLKAKRDFIAQVTHELKSPLASLQLHLETIRRRHPSPVKMETFLDTMLADTERLDTLVNNLLSANRLEQRGIRLSLKTVDFSAVVSNYFRPQQYALPRAGIMHLNVEPGLYARIEKEAIETVFRNLLENALLYSPSQPKIRISLHRDDKAAHFIIADEGRGIETKEQKKVFHIFYRGKRSGETIKGTGLGLFITQAAIRLHKGKVWLQSGDKGGTEVHISLPLIDPETEDMQK